MNPRIKPELQAKFLQYLNNRHNQANEGFTLIELLVVVIIIGVLAAIALPSLLGQVNKAKQSEGKNNIGAINRAQQAYYLENQAFNTDLTVLGIAIKTQTDNYNYTSVINGATTGSNLAVISHNALSRKVALRSYIGIVGTTTGDGATSEALTLAYACETDDSGIKNAVTIATGHGCPATFRSLAR
ncbi:type IV pilin-like G/H family protein [Nostoc sp. FACHB-110]|uniref:type IV pilin-like G/H family protein n=1 Tax=Nostoc sp. FACHB-110 TaxID=2692834 RepID=UPI001682CFD6|nr:type IV pilin-like G/H family protein [Nostoc sp. FACHB-110]MBD2438054.1 prepilin-type N-terminal cleavage/methylation domain-containing protein [Nostoc sp. FACHB-110]